MEEHLLTPLHRERLSTDSISGLADDRSSLRVRRNPILTRRRVLILFATLVILGIFGGSIYLIFSIIRYFWRMAFDPHRKNSNFFYSYPPVVSYYGDNIPQFDVVASVYVRTGKELPKGDLRYVYENSSWISSAYDDWQLLHSEAVFSKISLNSDKILKKTVNYSIPSDILSEFYKPLTFFPEIVNTFVIVPSEPDPVLDIVDLPQVDLKEAAMQNSHYSRPYNAPHDTPAPTSWTKHRIDQLARPMDSPPDRPDDVSRLANVSRSLNAFYNSGAVREFALHPVMDEEIMWDKSRSFERHGFFGLGKSNNVVDERMWLPFQRNASLKVKTRSWLSMAKETPVYDGDKYKKEQSHVGHEHLRHRQDPLNHFIGFVSSPFSSIGHYRSQIIHHFDAPDGPDSGFGPWGRNREDLKFYGPYTTLRKHAAGSEDWIVLPRLNNSSDLQKVPIDPIVVPWHISFDLLSNQKIIAVDVLNRDTWRDTLRWIDPSTNYGWSTNRAYEEANTLQMMDFINAIFRNSHTNSKRPILRSVFFLIGGFIQYPLGFFLQMYYLFSRSSSTGLSLPPTIIYLFYCSLYRAFYSWLYRYDYDKSTWLGRVIQVVDIVSIWRWTCLWWSIGFTWNGWNGWNGSVPVEFKRFGQTHSERTSKRADQRFTWTQRRMFVAVLTIILTYLPELPHVVKATYLEGPREPSYLWGSSGFFETVAAWSIKLRLPEFGSSLRTSLWLMATLAQVLLNWRSGTFAGSVPAFAWTQVVGTAISWTPTIFQSIFGKFHATDPLEIGVIVRFIIDLVILWQAMTLPTVNQEEQEDE